MSESVRLYEIIKSQEDKIISAAKTYNISKNVLVQKLGIDIRDTLQKKHIQIYQFFQITDEEMLNFYKALESAYFCIASFINTLNRFPNTEMFILYKTKRQQLNEYLVIMGMERNNFIETIGYLDYNHTDETNEN